MSVLPKGPTDLRTLLLAGGVGQFSAVMSIPYMNFLPSTTDPYAQGVIQLVQGLQRLLGKRGAKLRVTGVLDRETVVSLQRYAGPRWYEKSWAQLYQAVWIGRPWKGYSRLEREAQPKTGYIPAQLGDDGTSVDTSSIDTSDNPLVGTNATQTQQDTVYGAPAITGGSPSPADLQAGITSAVGKPAGGAVKSGLSLIGSIFDPNAWRTSSSSGSGLSTFGLAALAVGGLVAWSLWKKTPRELRGAKRALGGR